MAATARSEKRMTAGSGMDVSIYNVMIIDGGLGRKDVIDDLTRHRDGNERVHLWLNDVS